MKSAYYNEIDPYAAQWLRNLIDAGLIPHGDVDERSIVDVAPSDLAGYAQCHFFAGIGGWAYAARLAEWPDDRELWTGSCPCQPFSASGRGIGTDDPRHLWPHFFRLIRASRPSFVVGEQVPRAVGHGWIDGVFDDLESIDYAGRAVIVPACAVDSPMRGDRLWFVASADGERWEQRGLSPACDKKTHKKQASNWASYGSTATGWDRKQRRVDPDILRVAHGVPQRVGRLRAYGNAIVPQVAAEVIRAYMDCRP